MKRRIISLSTMALFGSLFVASAQADWIDWQSTSAGSLTDNGTTFGVSMTGNPYYLIDGDYYYNNASTGGTSATGTYAGLAPSDVIQVVGTGIFTLTFEQEVVNPYMALVSVGQPNYTVTYEFEDAFDVISAGANYWGYGGYSVNGTQFNGNEFNGVLQFTGAFTSISFEIMDREGWHGFNFGTANVESVPEPSALLLMTAGLIGLGITRRKASSS